MAIFFPQMVFDKAVVVGLQRSLFVLDDSLFQSSIPSGYSVRPLEKLVEGGPLILDREMLRIFPILVDEREEPSFLDC